MSAALFRAVGVHSARSITQLLSAITLVLRGAGGRYRRRRRHRGQRQRLRDHVSRTVA